MSYRLVGFSDSEAAEFTVRRFAKNSPAVIDSVVFNAANPVRYNRFGDTLIMVAFPANALLKSDYDYQLYFPLALRTISVSDIIEEQKTGGNNKTQCLNPLISCKIDGALKSIEFPGTVYLNR